MADKGRILVVDDDLNTLKMVEQFLLLKKHDVTTCLTFRDAMEEMGKGEFSAAFIDYFMPDITGLEMMKALHQVDPSLPVIILTASRDIKIAVETIREGAFNFLIKPVDPDEIYINLGNALKNRKLEKENQRLKLDLKDKYRFDHIIGNCGRMMEVFDLTMRASNVRSNILITGDTGSGKELIAKAIHFNSDRANGPFIRVNCSALAESLLESELFGIEKNVATGVNARMGKFEAADGGTLFLDEIGDMAQNTQAKVLRALQEREIERVGSNVPKRVDIRIIAATNIDLNKAVEEKKFRQDLYYRLNVLVIPLPRLADRQQDIPQLIDHFLEKYCGENSLATKKISTEAVDKLLSYHWPGNVRELENIVERAVVMCDSDTVTTDHLPSYVLDGAGESSSVPPVTGRNMDSLVNDYERRIIIAALERCAWKQNRAATELGITERSIWYKIKKLGIDIKKSRPEDTPG